MITTFNGLLPQPFSLDLHIYTQGICNHVYFMSIKLPIKLKQRIQHSIHMLLQLLYIVEVETKAYAQ